MSRLRHFFWWSFLLTMVWFCKSETSISRIIDIDRYLQMESAMISKGRNYLFQEQNRLNLLKMYLRDWKHWRKSYSNQESEYTAIPQNIFHLFKKLTSDLDQTEKTMMENSYKSTMIPDDFEPPTENHLKKVVLSLVDLQNLYDLKSNEIMNGKLLDIQLNTSLTKDSIHFIGKTCLEYNKHLCVTDWLNSWLSDSGDSPDNPNRRKEVYKFLYSSYIFMNQKYEAYNYTSKYLEEDPHDISATDAALDLSFAIGKLSKVDMDFLETNRLCRGDYDSNSHTIRSNLKCRYKHGDSAFLKIAPLKEEELYDNPKVILYRDAIYDSEIKKIKIWVDRLTTALVYGMDGSCCYTSFTSRISEVGYMNNKSPGVIMLSKRIEDISDMLIDTGEAWQLLGYSPGGHYKIHSDYVYGTNEYLEMHGNRVASMLFYFNDVTLGGETVFPRIELSVKPIKGAAIIWYNVHSDGTVNIMADHCGCPVLIGEKYGFTQWFRSKNQISSRRIFDDDLIISTEPSRIFTQVYKHVKRKSIGR